MKTAVVFLTLTVVTFAKPEGYYHQAYGYKASSASYRNNELQRSTDDEGYYSRHGDLEGRYQPKVNAHDQHSEYINPGIKQGSGHLGYRSGYDTHHQQQSTLVEITAQLQQELERELQREVYDQYRQSAAHNNFVSQSQIEADTRHLEEQLKSKLTARLQELLRSHFGTQAMRGGHSYSIVNGRVQPTPNYSNQELQELTRRMEESLRRHLEQYVQSYYHASGNTVNHGYRVPDPLVQASSPAPRVHQPYPQSTPSYQPYQPSHGDSRNTVATRAQTELNEQLNQMLAQVQREHFASSYGYHAGNYDAVLERLREQLRGNITQFFETQVRGAYGYLSQYSSEDVATLKRQIETQLMAKLEREFNRQKEQFRQSQGAASNTRYHVLVPARNNYHQPSAPSDQLPYGNNYHQPAAPSDYQSQTQIETIHRQMQERLSRQLQDALRQHSQTHMYAAGGDSQANYQATLSQLTAELNRNLTKQMEQFYSGSSYQGAQASQLASLRNQLQRELTNELQQGLQQSYRYSYSSSWSGSASSSHNSNYRSGVKGGLYPNLNDVDGGYGHQASATEASRWPRHY